ncbi:hypothetical protein ANN_26472 [Periplaneta americana]|uniref:Uncharacterized protein n=1 Tax=Periplaneta americana TaxID=6978 RepID=A0ABQ8RY88_PERAM|nr:hypothetical protein ANN_26472 [Periplaneta americana]
MFADHCDLRDKHLLNKTPPQTTQLLQGYQLLQNYIDMRKAVLCNTLFGFIKKRHTGDIVETAKMKFRDTLVLQQDGAPAHFALQVRRYLTFPNRWIGRRSADDQAPFAWPARSPDFITLDIAL